MNITKTNNDIAMEVLKSEDISDGSKAVLLQALGAYLVTLTAQNNTKISIGSPSTMRSFTPEEEKAYQKAVGKVYTHKGD